MVIVFPSLSDNSIIIEFYIEESFFMFITITLVEPEPRF
jgi:hypothetical protein